MLLAPCQSFFSIFLEFFQIFFKRLPIHVGTDNGTIEHCQPSRSFVHSRKVACDFIGTGCDTASKSRTVHQVHTVLITVRTFYQMPLFKYPIQG